MLHHEGTKDPKDTQVNKASALALSHQIIGAAIEVHRSIGLSLRGIAFERQVGLAVKYKGDLLDCQVKIDLLVERTVIINYPFVSFVPSW